MQPNNYICINGEFLHGNVPVLYSANRAFRYNDALTENIHASATVPQFLDLHMERLIEHMKMISMQVPSNLNTVNAGKLITGLLNKNRIFGGAHIRLTVFRNGAGALMPEGNDVTYLIDAEPLADNRYTLNDKGISIGISEKYVRYSRDPATVHRANLSLFMLALMEAEKRGFDNIILLNEAGRITEAADANIFLVSGNALFTPALQQGCIDGVMRKIILECAVEAGFRINDQSSLTSASLYDAEEIFLTNAVQGIRWVGAFEQKRYFSKTSRLLNGMLNARAFE